MCPHLIGTDAGGTISVTKTKVDTVRNSGTGVLYTGTMKIEDADSEVVIDGTLILEMKHGEVEIHADKAVQGDHVFLTGLNSTHELFSGNYLLLQELDNSKKDITVNSISQNKTVTVKAPVLFENAAFNVDTLTVAESVKLILDGSTTMSVDKVSVTSGKELEVTGNTGTVQMT